MLLSVQFTVLTLSTMQKFYAICVFFILFIQSDGQLLPKASVYKKTVNRTECMENKIIKYNSTNVADSHFNIKENNSYGFFDFWRQNLQSFIAEKPVNIHGISFVLNYRSVMIKPYTIILTVRFHISTLNVTPISIAVNGRKRGLFSIIIPIDNVIRIDFFPKPLVYNLQISKVKIWVPTEAYFSDTFLTYFAARDFCSQNGMQLAHLDYISDIGIFQYIFKTDVFYWIGLNNIERHAIWKWEDGSILSLKEPKYHFVYGQPNGTETENCVTLHNSDRALYNVKCSYTERFTCENIGKKCSTLPIAHKCGDYKGSSYYLVNNEYLTFYDANEYCRNATGGKLMTIKDDSHKNWTHDFTNSLGIVWIGLKFDGRVWKWLDGTEFNSNFAHFWSANSSQGNPPARKLENCVYLWYAQLDDDNCFNKRRFICTSLKRVRSYHKIFQPNISATYQIDTNGYKKRLRHDNLNLGSYRQDKDWLVKCIQTDIMEGNKHPPSCPSDPLLSKPRLLIEFEIPIHVKGILVYHYPAGLMQKYRKGDYSKEFEEYNSYLWFVGENIATERIPCWYSEVDNIKPSMDMIYELDCNIQNLIKLHIACETVYECRILLCGLKVFF